MLLGSGLTNMYFGNRYICNNRGTAGNGVFYADYVEAICKEDQWDKPLS